MRIDLQDLLHINLRRIKKEMSLSEIEENLNKNVEECIENSIAILKNTDEKYKENKDSLDQVNSINNVNNLNNINTKRNHQINDILGIGQKEIDKIKENKWEEGKKGKGEMEIQDELQEEEIKKEIENEIEEIDKIEELEKEIFDEVHFNAKILALKAQKAILANEKEGSQIAELFFPTSMYSYLMRDKQLEIVGSCDKIEIVDGKYYPISLKSSPPPLKGVWDGDSIELVASALLIEQEFDTEVFVGFVDYLKLGDRRPVVMDANLRKGLFKVLNEIKSIINEKTIPDVNIKREKCINCDYKDICHEQDYLI